MTHGTDPSPWQIQKTCDIATVEQADEIERMVAESAHQALRALRRCEHAEESLSLLWKLKSGLGGLDPIDPKRPLNFIEQLNQSFTYLASARAAKWLLQHHPELGPFSVNLGTMKGRDIYSKADPTKLHGEVFAAANVTNNQKLKRDIAYLKKNGSELQYAFFMAPQHVEGRQPALEARFSSEGVRIVALRAPEWTATPPGLAEVRSGRESAAST
ncbi:hypothetical protein [Hydrogenophaga sp. 2FB]|uniref:hypothetical protein n=1 Tax=Hydrogenophaga sp. 2FB TaxID=2502187 RepID=UPI0010F63329|nr:hypothetical protein [Hydrogenophaga sp. 2FB]